MLPELQQLIHLQQLENTADATRGQLKNIPVRLETLATRLAEHAENVKSATLAFTKHRTSRAAFEKDVAEAQSRLSRFKGQLMAVKTNREYQAIQTEIAGGEREVENLEDELLKRMLEADDFNQDVTYAEQRLVEERTAADAERKRVEQERTALEAQLTTFDSELNMLVEQLSSQAMSLFETLTRGRNGIAVVEASQGRWTSCQVRLRPQLFNDVRSNKALIQCESCQRILYVAEPQTVVG